MRHGSVMGHGQARDICGRDVARRSQHAISRPIAPCRELALLARAVLMLPGMTDTRVEGMLGLGWQQLRGRGPSRDAAGADAPLRTGSGHEVSTRWWSRRTASEPQVQLAGESSVHVVSGELLEEQWCRGDEGGWRYCARRLRKGDGSTLAAGAIRRVAALRESCVVLVAEPGALGPIDAALWPVLRLARAAMIERAPEHTVVELSAPDPESIDEGDA